MDAFAGITADQVSFGWLDMRRKKLASKMVRMAISLFIAIVFIGDSHRSSLGQDLKGYESPFMIVHPIDFAGNDNAPKAQAYFHSVLETYGFVLYGYLPPRDPQREQNYSDYRECVAKNKNRKWQLFGWLWGSSLKASAAAQMIRYEIPLVCQEYAGKGDGRRQPPRIVSRQEWQSYSDIQRKFYVSAYVESSLELWILQKSPSDIDRLAQCMKVKGVNAVLAKLKDIEIEWQYPMPWSVSRALGAVCLA